MSCSIPWVVIPPFTVSLLAFTWEHTHKCISLAVVSVHVSLRFQEHTECTFTQTIALSFVSPLYLSPSPCLFKGLSGPLRSWGVEFQSCAQTVWFMMETELALVSLLSLCVWTISIQYPIPPHESCFPLKNKFNTLERFSFCTPITLTYFWLKTTHHESN